MLAVEQYCAAAPSIDTYVEGFLTVALTTLVDELSLDQPHSENSNPVAFTLSFILRCLEFSYYSVDSKSNRVYILVYVIEFFQRHGAGPRTRPAWPSKT